jgi:hypothetical protein
VHVHAGLYGGWGIDMGIGEVDIQKGKIAWIAHYILYYVLPVDYSLVQISGY